MLTLSSHVRYQYRFSISQILQMASLYQIPVVGPDVSFDLIPRNPNQILPTNLPP